MKKGLLKKILFAVLYSLNLIIGFFIGYFQAESQSEISLISFSIVLPVLLLIIIILTILFMKGNRIKTKYVIYILIYFILNLFFGLVIGFSIPLMTGFNPENMGYVMIPLLCVLNYNIVDRLDIYIKENLSPDKLNKDLDKGEELVTDKPRQDFYRKRNFLRNLGFWGLFSGNLLLAFIFGYIISRIFPSIPYLLTLLILLIPFSIIIAILTKLIIKGNQIEIKYKCYIFVYFLSNLIVAFLIGYNLAIVDIKDVEIIGYLMIPLLCLINLSIINRLDLYIKDHSSLNGENNELITRKLPIIEYEGKNYIFSIESLIILGIGAPFLVLLIYFFFAWEWNYWLHEIVIKQTTFFLNWFFDMGVTLIYLPGEYNPWKFNIPGTPNIISLETFCTGIQAICIFVGIFLLTPHSKDTKTRQSTIWRKVKGIIISSIIFYVVNILRMIIQLYLYYLGYPWNDIHYSISVASSFIAAVIVLLMHKWVPEFILSFIYVFSLIKGGSKPKNKKVKVLVCSNCSAVAINLKQKTCQNCGLMLVKSTGIKCSECGTISPNKEQLVCEKCGAEIRSLKKRKN